VFTRAWASARSRFPDVSLIISPPASLRSTS